MCLRMLREMDEVEEEQQGKVTEYPDEVLDCTLVFECFHFISILLVYFHLKANCPFYLPTIT